MVSTNTTKIHVTVPFLWNSLLGKYGMQGISWKLETFVMHSDVVYNRIQDSRKWNWNERLDPDCQVSLMWWQEFWIVLGSKESLDFTLKQWVTQKQYQESEENYFFLKQLGNLVLENYSLLQRNAMLLKMTSWLYGPFGHNFCVILPCLFSQRPILCLPVFHPWLWPSAESTDKSVDKCGE